MTLQLQSSRSTASPHAAISAQERQFEKVKAPAKKALSFSRNWANAPNKERRKDQAQPGKKKWTPEQLEKKKWNSDKKRWKNKKGSVGSKSDGNFDEHSSSSTSSSGGRVSSWSRSRKSDLSEISGSSSSAVSSSGDSRSRRTTENRIGSSSTSTRISRGSSTSSSSDSRAFDLQCPGNVDGTLVQYWNVQPSDLQRQPPEWATPNKYGRALSAVVALHGDLLVG